MERGVAECKTDTISAYIHRYKETNEPGNRHPDLYIGAPQKRRRQHSRHVRSHNAAYPSGGVGSLPRFSAEGAGSRPDRDSRCERTFDRKPGCREGAGDSLPVPEPERRSHRGSRARTHPTAYGAARTRPHEQGDRPFRVRSGSQSRIGGGQYARFRFGRIRRR